MELVNIKYSGTKPYTDKTAMRQQWLEGDVKAVLKQDVRLLTQFAEFSVVPDKPSKKADKAESTKTTEPDLTEKTPEQIAQEQALLQAKMKEDQERDDERQQRENMQNAIQDWTKDSLIDYAAKYEVKLNKQAKVGDLRLEVSNLIDAHGVR